MSSFEEEAKEQLKAYAPDISQIGPGLYMERMSIPALGRTWGGLMVRALEEKAEDMKRRCLQYIYIWTEQKSVVSLLWMFWVPLLMGVWGLLAWEIYSPLIAASELLLPVLATGLAGLPLLLTGVYDQ